mgnify:CR=1 FL=1
MHQINRKIQNKIDNIKYLQNELMNFKNFSEDEISNLLQKFEKTPRDEVSFYFKALFTNLEFANVLLEIADKYKENKKIQINILSSIGNMIRRYGLEETDEIYDYFKTNMFIKNVGVYVAIHLPYLKRFEKENSWEYFMKIKDMSVNFKIVTETTFLNIVNEHITEIPNEHKGEVIALLKQKQQNSNNEGGQKYYQELIYTILKGE